MPEADYTLEVQGYELATNTVQDPRRESSLGGLQEAADAGRRQLPLFSELPAEAEAASHQAADNFLVRYKQVNEAITDTRNGAAARAEITGEPRPDTERSEQVNRQKAGQGRETPSDLFGAVSSEAQSLPDARRRVVGELVLDLTDLVYTGYVGVGFL